MNLPKGLRWTFEIYVGLVQRDQRISCSLVQVEKARAMNYAKLMFAISSPHAVKWRDLQACITAQLNNYRILYNKGAT